MKHTSTPLSEFFRTPFKSNIEMGSFGCMKPWWSSSLAQNVCYCFICIVANCMNNKYGPRYVCCNEDMIKGPEQVQQKFCFFFGVPRRYVRFFKDIWYYIVIVYFIVICTVCRFEPRKSLQTETVAQKWLVSETFHNKTVFLCPSFHGLSVIMHGSL